MVLNINTEIDLKVSGEIKRYILMKISALFENLKSLGCQN